MCMINPRVDFAFKKLFGSVENKDLLIDFINSVISEADRVKDIEIKIHIMSRILRMINYPYWI